MLKRGGDFGGPQAVSHVQNNPDSSAWIVKGLLALYSGFPAWTFSYWPSSNEQQPGRQNGS